MWISNSLELSFTNIWDLCSNFADCEFPWIKLSWHSCSMWDKRRWLNFGNFSVSCYLPLIWKVSIAHMHGLVVYVEEGRPFAWALSLENSKHSYDFDWLHIIQCRTSYSSVDRLLRLYAVFDSYFIKHRCGSLDQPIMRLSLETLTSIIMTG